MKNKYINLLLQEFGNDKVFVFKQTDYDFVIIGYPHLRAYLYFHTGIRVEVIPNINMHERQIYIPGSNATKEKIDISENDQIVNDQFFKTIPEEQIKLVEKFPDTHWTILRALNYCGKEFIQLIESNASLAYIAVNLEVLNLSYTLVETFELIKDLSITKRKEILEKALFPATEQMVKIFSKIDPIYLNVKRLKSLLYLLSNKNRNRKNVLTILSNVKTINLNLIKLLTFYPRSIEYLSPDFILKLSNSNKLIENIRRLEQIRVIEEQLNLNKIGINEIEEIEQVHQKLIKKKETAEKFPQPPIEGNDYIFPLKNAIEQIRWSKIKHNCIRSHILKVKKNQSYFYKVILNEENATLEVIIKKGKVSLGSLLGFKNKRVSNTLRKMVNSWFEKFLEKGDTLEIDV